MVLYVGWSHLGELFGCSYKVSDPYVARTNVTKQSRKEGDDTRLVWVGT